jgi:hypothetical protein
LIRLFFLDAHQYFSPLSLFQLANGGFSVDFLLLRFFLRFSDQVVIGCYEQE